MREQLHRDPNLTKFLPKAARGLSTLRSAVVVSELTSAPRAQHFSASSRAHTHALQNLRARSSGWALHQLPKAVREAKRACPELNAAHPALLCNVEMEPLQMSYTGTAVLPVASAVCRRPPLPFGAYVQTMHGKRADGLQVSARVPAVWPLVVSASQFIFGDEIADCLDDYRVRDVTRTTLVATIQDDIRVFLRARRVHLPSNVDVSQVQLVYETPVDGGRFVYVPLPPAATAEAADLFNTSQRLLATPLTCDELQRLRHAATMS